MYVHHKNHFWGIFSHPQSEWLDIRREEKNLLQFALTRLFYYALIPSLSLFLGLSFLGWSFTGQHFNSVAFTTSIPLIAIFYCAIIFSTLLMAYITYKVENHFGTEASFERCFIFITYTATPMYMAGFAALVPILWLNLVILMSAVAYSLHLLHIGIPLYMQLVEGKAIIVSVTIITAGLCNLVLFISGIGILWLALN